MPKETIPKFMLQFWRDSPTVYTRDDIFHLEPSSENAVFLKYIALNCKTDSENIRSLVTSDNEDFVTSGNLKFTVQD